MTRKRVRELWALGAGVGLGVLASKVSGLDFVSGVAMLALLSYGLESGYALTDWVLLGAVAWMRKR